MAQSELIQRLKQIVRFSMLDDEVLADLATLVVEERYSPGEVICRQGELGDRAYAIEVGNVVVQADVEGKKVDVAHMSGGDIFGERALTGALPRAATIIAETPLHLLSLHREDYQQLAQKHPSLKRLLVGPDVVPLLGQVELFSRLTQEELGALSEHVGVHFYPPGYRVVEQGEMGATMYVVIHGDLVAYQLDQRGRARPVKALQKGDFFGETSLLIGEPRDATVITKTYTEVCYINKASFDGFLQAHPNVRHELQVRPDVERKWKAGPFPGQNPDEIVEIMAHKHWVAFLASLMRPVLWLALFGAAVVALDALWLGSAGSVTDLAWLSALLTMLWVVVVVAVSIWYWIEWRNDHYIVTTQRVVHIERVLLQAMTTDVVPVRQIQNVDLEQDLLGQILDYGHVRIITAGPAGGGGAMNLRYVPGPEAFHQTIFEQVDRARYRDVATERSQLRQAIRQAMGWSVLEEEPPEASPPASRRRRSWIALLTENRLIKRLRKTFTESGLAVFLRRPHLPRQEIRLKDQVIWRKHWGVFLKVTYRPFLLCLLIFVLIVLAAAAWLGVVAPFGLQPSWFGTALWVLTIGFIPALGWLFWELEDWRNDLYIVTNTHIIDIERVTPILLKETKRQASLDDIQNTMASTRGFWANLLKWGDVFIETAGEGRFEFEQVHNPARVQAEIDKRREAYRAKQRQEETERQRAELAKWFSAYHDVTRDAETRARWEARMPPPESLLQEMDEQDTGEQEV